MKTREPDFIEIIAAPGRGKTTLLINALKERLKNGDRVLIVLPDQSEAAWVPFIKRFGVINAENLEEQFNPNFKNVCLVEFEEKITFEFLFNQFKKGVLKDLILVLDDPQYLNSSPEKALIRILSRKRQFKADIFSNAHSFDQVPQKFFQYITLYGLGHTTAEIILRKDQLPKAIIDLKKRVDNISNVPKGKPNYYYYEFFNKFGDPIK